MNIPPAFGSLLLLYSLLFGSGPDLLFAVGPTAVIRRPVHPVLIRNDSDPVLKIVVDIPEGATTSVTSFSFSLAGTDDLRDIAALQLFSTGDQDGFSTESPLGKSFRAEPAISAPCDLVLKPGRNVLWLAARLDPRASLSHGIATTCTSIETSGGMLVPRDESPSKRQRIGVALRKHNDDGVHTYRIPALTRSKRNSLLCVYDMRRNEGRDLQEDIDIGLSRSTDGGQTWEPVRVIMDMGEYGGLPQAQNGCSDPGIIVDRQTGDIFCFAVWMNGKPGKHQWTEDGSEAGYEIGKSAQIQMVKSSDDGLTWTKPQNLTRTLKQEAWWLFAPSPQSGFNLPDGTLVMPVQGRDARGETFATIMTSRDHGTNWTVGKSAFVGGNECQAALLGDGSIMLNIRNDYERFRGVMTTRDMGESWETHPSNRSALIEPNCNGSLLRFDYKEGSERKHMLLFSNPHTQKGRTHQTVQVSLDDGLTWPESRHLLLDEGKGAGYPSLTQIDDQQVGIVYEGSRAHLVFERISLDELLRN